MEKLLTGRFGPKYQIDLDKKLARCVLVKPMVVDFSELADGIKRNNMGVGGFFFEARASRTDARVRIEGSRQELTLRGDWPGGSEPRWSRLRVVEWAPGALPVVEWMGEALPLPDQATPAR